jgi:hypothetical protein
MGFGRDYEPDKQHPAITKQCELIADDAVIRLLPADR